MNTNFITQQDIEHRDYYIAQALNGNTACTWPVLINLWEMVITSEPGDILEIGCWRGGSSLVIAATAARFKPTSHFYICDTFQGLVKSGPNDNCHKDGDFQDTSKEHVENLLSRHGLNNFSICQGIFPDQTAHMIHSRKLSLIHVDVDIYQCYVDILHWSQHRLTPGGILVFDDYNTASCAGAAIAVDEFFASRTDYNLTRLNHNGVAVARYMG